jgi:hypothetical protein
MTHISFVNFHPSPFAMESSNSSPVNPYFLPPPCMAYDSAGALLRIEDHDMAQLRKEGFSLGTFAIHGSTSLYLARSLSLPLSLSLQIELTESSPDFTINRFDPGHDGP